MLLSALDLDEHTPCRRSAGRPVQCLAVSSPAVAGGLQALPRGSYHIMRAAADAYARSQRGDDDENKSSSETPSTPPSTPPSSAPKEETSTESGQDVRCLLLLSCGSLSSYSQGKSGAS